MGNIQNIQKVHFEDLQNSINHNNEVILINTLKSINQSCLIYNTIQIDSEEDIINNLLKKNKNKKIIIYGKNYNDITVYKKYNQLKQLGFTNIYVYPGGIFEWLCLQDIFGTELFKTKGQELNILKFK
jgi:rhodanese-related sulfurtransferase